MQVLAPNWQVRKTELNFWKNYFTGRKKLFFFLKKKKNLLIYLWCEPLYSTGGCFKKKEGLAKFQFLEGGWWERGGDIKHEIFNDKKVYKQKYFSVI